MKTRLEACKKDVLKALRRHNMRGVVYLVQPVALGEGKGAVHGALVQTLEPMTGAMATAIARQMEAKLAPIFAALYRYADLHGDQTCSDGCASHHTPMGDGEAV